MATSKTIIVCDVGTSALKMGYSNENYPSFHIPTIVGLPTMQISRRVKNSEKEAFATSQMIDGYYIGNEALELVDDLEITYPIVNGIIVDREKTELVLKYAFFNIMKIKNPEDYCVMLTQASDSPVKHTEQILRLILEKFSFHGAYVATQALLSLHGQGLTTGLVLDSGAGVSHVVPFVDGTKLYGMRLDIAGQNITSHLINLYQKKGYAFNYSADYQTAEQIKKKYCFIARNTEKENILTDETTFNDKRIKTPIGMITLGNECYEAPEILFNPILVDNERPGIAEMCFNSIQKQDVSLRMPLYKHIVLSGGTSTLIGFRTRMELELVQLSTVKFSAAVASKQTPVIIDNPNRLSSVFLGAALFSNIGSENIPNFWVTKESLQEQQVVELIKNMH